MSQQKGVKTRGGDTKGEKEGKMPEISCKRKSVGKVIC